MRRRVSEMWREDPMLVGFFGFLAVVIVIVVWGGVRLGQERARRDAEWTEYASRHCKVVEHRPSPTQASVFYDVWKCDDGTLYWRVAR